MRFVIDYKDKVQERILSYIVEDCSFSMEPFISNYDLELILNKLSLPLVDNKVMQVDGFCGFSEWIKMRYQVPSYKQGALKVEHNLEHDYAYGIYDRDLPVYVNGKSGWVCLGSPQQPGKAVEFIRNCVAVVDNSQELAALWLRPRSLPEL
jgi:hypothetical protein